MCGLCGLIEEQTDWTNSLRKKEMPRRQDRYQRLKLLNQIIAPYRIRVSDVHGVNYLLQTATGKQQIVNGLDELWLAVKSLSNQCFDVLDDTYLGQLQQAMPKAGI
ncbi:hypothetical protein LU293_02800 [Moraxella nasovis]|uniref:hypothetical protein n=1 Tax=Moraxella nasovis TaxID=2904121 RepID=UPI001F60BCC0|nr:hypothetical protein [Moraxella nasovis]UNU73846.1 hypothetical protein LU293_02800 [Moraxella nasovis]